MEVRTYPTGHFQGTVKVPGDKSISHRALMIASISTGRSVIRGLLTADDPQSTIGCIRNLGIPVESKNNELLITGKGKRGLTPPTTFLDCGNSGTTMRLMTGILVGQAFASELRGDRSLSRRPMKRVIDPLVQLGARIEATREFTAPLKISGGHPLRGIRYELPVASAQVKSAVLFAGLYADGATRVVESVQTRDHTERMLGLKVLNDGENSIVETNGNIELVGRDFVVPGDISSAVFLIVAAIVSQKSNLRVHRVGLNPTRTAVLDLLRSLGADIQIENTAEVAGEPFGDLVVRHSNMSPGMKINSVMVPGVVDEIPALAVLAATCGMSFELSGATELRNKESDRIAALVRNLRSMGLNVDERPDGFNFEGKNELRGCTVESFGDHRIAMAFGVAGLKVPGILISGAECAEISFPHFWETLSRLCGN